ncbi:MAG: CRISPR-associated RAMP protein [Acidobacteriia bacterium]|nr:CRISPR-associated RAMP protein [Terriglobia bacterium]
MSPAPLGFLSLQSRYVVEGTLKSMAAMHVGSGLEGVNSDAAWMRDAAGIFIPGSSLRGVMRSTLERILQSVRPERGCVLFLTDSGSRCATACEAERTKLEKLPEAERLKKIYAGDLCDICLLFGSPLLASRLRVSDSRPGKAVEPQPRHGVGIDRDTETAREKIKFDFEALEAGPRFGFRIELENARPQDFALLGILLIEMQSTGLWVGGKKSRGLGHCVLEPEYRVSHFDNDGPFKLPEYLKTGQLKKFETKDFAARLAAAVSHYLEEASHVQAAGQ